MLCRSIVSAVILSLLCLVGLYTTAVADNWPRFLGPNGDANTDDKNIPLEWTPDDVVWRTELGGVGQSSPIIWQDRIFVTTSEKTSSGQAARTVLCVNRADGRILWKQQVSAGPGEELHKMNTWATPSCATDGERVVAYFGPGGLHCFDMDGKKQWSRDELVEVVGPWGFAASPIILGDKIIQNCDSFGESYLIALNKASGKEIWRSKRKELPRGGWSTPILIDTGKRKELVLNGEFGVQGYDPETGEDYWFCKSFNGRGTPVPAFAAGVLITVNGKPGDVYAVRPGGSGDVTETHMAWHTRRGGGRDLPSPVAAGKFVFVVNMTGIGTMYDAATGKQLWQSRIGGNFSATPFVAGGLIYAQDEGGTTVVIRPGDKLDVVSRNSLGETGDEIFRASPAPVDGRVYCRSDSALYCIGGKAAE